MLRETRARASLKTKRTAFRLPNIKYYCKGYFSTRQVHLNSAPYSRVLHKLTTGPELVKKFHPPPLRFMSQINPVHAPLPMPLLESHKICNYIINDRPQTIGYKINVHKSAS
jgi:hypothetical protein